MQKKNVPKHFEVIILVIVVRYLILPTLKKCVLFFSESFRAQEQSDLVHKTQK